MNFPSICYLTLSFKEETYGVDRGLHENKPMHYIPSTQTGMEAWPGQGTFFITFFNISQITTCHCQNTTRSIVSFGCSSSCKKNNKINTSSLLCLLCCDTSFSDLLPSRQKIKDKSMIATVLSFTREADMTKLIQTLQKVHHFDLLPGKVSLPPFFPLIYEETFSKSS